jgi:hypothetical protein
VEIAITAEPVRSAAPGPGPSVCAVTGSNAGPAEGRDCDHHGGSLARIQRRRRVRCRLPCEVLVERGRSVRASVLTLSEGGLSVAVLLEVDQGDPIRLRIAPQRGARAVTVDGIVWNTRPASRSNPNGGLRMVGCVVSDPPAPFIELLDEVQQRSAPRVRTPTPRPSRPEIEFDLPRSRAPLPPPKPEPDESLPCFRVRLKQVGGPRTRVLSVRAHSAAQAEERAREELAAASGDGADAWEVI